MIVIITILNNYYLSLRSEEKIEPNTEECSNFTSFLNSHMKFILTILIVSFLMKENEIYNLNKSYKEIQEIIFYALLYNINNIINYFNSNIGEYCIEIFANILVLMSCLYVEDKEHKSLFSFGKNKQINAVKKALNYYSLKYKKLFDTSELEKISSQNIIKVKEMLLEEKNNLYDSII